MESFVARLQGWGFPLMAVNKEGKLPTCCTDWGSLTRAHLLLCLKWLLMHCGGSGQSSARQSGLHRKPFSLPLTYCFGFISGQVFFTLTFALFTPYSDLLQKQRTTQTLVPLPLSPRVQRNPAGTRTGRNTRLRLSLLLV